jgi:hypothetical protein
MKTKEQIEKEINILNKQVNKYKCGDKTIDKIIVFLASERLNALEWVLLEDEKSRTR